MTKRSCEGCVHFVNGYWCREFDSPARHRCDFAEDEIPSSYEMELEENTPDGVGLK